MKQINRSILTGLLISMFSLFAIQSVAFAADCGGCTPQTNNENLAKAINSAEEALNHVNQGHKDEAKAAIDDSMKSFGLIVSTPWAGKMQRPGEDIRYAGYALKRGDMDKAAKLLTVGIAGLGKVGPFK